MEQKKHTRAEQARINGAKSEGPKTPEGLQRCREASVKHGMWVAHLSTLPHEDQIQYAAIYAAAEDQFRPRNAVESAIVGLLADALWRANRLGNLANGDIHREMWTIAQQTPNNPGEPEIHLRAEQTSKSVERLEARARHYTREINRLIDMLRKLQAWPVSTEASQVVNEIKEMTPAVPPKPPAPAPQPPPAGEEPARKPQHPAQATPQRGGKRLRR